MTLTAIKIIIVIIPPYLKPGDTIGILCPAGYMPYEKATTAIETLTGWGFHVVPGKTLGTPVPLFFRNR